MRHIVLQLLIDLCSIHVVKRDKKEIVACNPKAANRIKNNMIKIAVKISN